MATHTASAIPGMEPSMTLVFLPGCKACGHKHPRAYMPPLEQDDCPGCGAAVAPPGLPVVADAYLSLSGLWGLLVRNLLRAAQALRDAAARI